MRRKKRKEEKRKENKRREKKREEKNRKEMELGKYIPSAAVQECLLLVLKF